MKQVVYIQRDDGQSTTHSRDGPEHNGRSTPVWVLSQIIPGATSSVKALVLKKPGEASVEIVPDPVAAPGELLLRVRMVGFCGSDLNSFRGRNPLVTFPRIPGHEVSATVIEGDSSLPAETDVALHIRAAAGALRAGGDVRMRASSIRLSACNGTERLRNSSRCHERSCIRRNSRGKSCAWSNR
jgi:hypothetical protein